MEQLHVLMLHWQAIEGLLSQAGPFIYTATRRSLKALDLA
jgi:hypothetical protein